VIRRSPRICRGQRHDKSAENALSPCNIGPLPAALCASETYSYTAAHPALRYLPALESTSPAPHHNVAHRTSSTRHLPASRQCKTARRGARAFSSPAASPPHPRRRAVPLLSPASALPALTHAPISAATTRPQLPCSRTIHIDLSNHTARPSPGQAPTGSTATTTGTSAAAPVTR
jgi:hypothetical protein